MEKVQKEEKSRGVGSRKKPATLVEVARLSGVSTAAVSMAINPPQTRTRVSQAARQRIMRAAEKLNYRPNPSARSLALSRTHQIGLYLNSPDSLNLSLTPWREVITKIQAGLWKTGYRLGIYYFEPGQDSGLKDFLIPNRYVDGILVQGRELSPAEIAAIRHSGMPAVSLYQVIEGFHSLTIDEEQMGRDAADYLYRMGHRKVAIFAARFERRAWNTRITGFLRRSEELGILPPKSHQLIEPIGNRIAGSLDLPTELYRRFSRIRKQITALYCPSDYLSFALLNQFDQEGIRVGHDISLLSYDNLEGYGFRPWKKARLTSFSPPFQKIASQIVSLLSRSHPDQPPVHQAFYPELVERGSVVNRTKHSLKVK